MLTCPAQTPAGSRPRRPRCSPGRSAPWSLRSRTARSPPPPPHPRSGGLLGRTSVPTHCTPCIAGEDTERHSLLGDSDETKLPCSFRSIGFPVSFFLSLLHPSEKARKGSKRRKQGKEARKGSEEKDAKTVTSKKRELSKLNIPES